MELGASDAEEQDGRAGDPLGEVFDEIEERRFAPLDVVEDDDERTPRGEMLEELSDRPEGLLNRGTGGFVQQSAEPRLHEGPVAVGRKQLCQLRPRVGRSVGVLDPGGLPEHPDDRPERDAFAVRQAAAADDSGGLTDSGEELADESRLADPRWTEDRDQLAHVLLHAAERLGEQLQLPAPADECDCVVAARPTGDRAGHDVHDPPRRHGIPDAPEPERAGLLQYDAVAHEALGFPADQDLAGLGSVFEAACEVDRVAHDEGLAGVRVARNHLPGVHADPDLDGDAPRVLELVVQARERVPHVDRGPDGAQCVVLVQPRHAEDGHDRVADELLHRAAVALQHDAHLGEVAVHQLPQRLGVELLSERGRALDVREDHGDDLAHAGPRGRPCEGCAAVLARASVGLVLRAACRTDRRRHAVRQRHAPSPPARRRNRPT